MKLLKHGFQKEQQKLSLFIRLLVNCSIKVRLGLITLDESEKNYLPLEVTFYGNFTALPYNVTFNF